VDWEAERKEVGKNWSRSRFAESEE
jgi:hypothetical protein